MRRRLPLIHQSVDELKHLLKTEKDVRKRQRVQLLYMLCTGQAKTRQDAAALLGVHRHTIGSWLSAYEEGDLEALCTIQTAPGKSPRYTPEVLAKLRDRLATPEGFSSYREIQRYLEAEHGIQLSYSRVHQLVRYELKAKPKTPRPSAKKKIQPRCKPSWTPLVNKLKRCD
jgi:transposase